MATTGASGTQSPAEDMKPIKEVVQSTPSQEESFQQSSFIIPQSSSPQLKLLFMYPKMR